MAKRLKRERRLSKTKKRGEKKDQSTLMCNSAICDLLLRFGGICFSNSAHL